MTSNNSSEYKVVADKIVSPDEDIIFRVEGALYLNSIEEENRIATVSDLGAGQNANTGNFIFEDSAATAPGDISITSNTAPGTITLSAYAGVEVTTSAGFGLTSNQVSTNNLKIQDAGHIFEDSNIIIESNDGYGIVLLSDQTVAIESNNGDIVLNADGNIYKNSNSSDGNRLLTYGNLDAYVGDATVNGSTGNTIADRINAISGGTPAELGDFQFNAGTAHVDNAQTLRIDSQDYNSEIKSSLILNPNDPSASLEAYSTDSVWFDGSWDSATWSGNTVTIVNTPNIIEFFNTVNGDISGVAVNGGQRVIYGGAGYGATDITVNIGGDPADPSTTVSSIEFYYTITSKVDIDHDNGSLDIVGNGMDVRITASDDLLITAEGDDIYLQANDDIRFVSNYEEPNAIEHHWRMDSEGEFHLPGAGYISNPIDSSGDGGGADTLVLVPDENLIYNGGHQYLIIDPTAPNHIHIRPGGEQDNSSAQIYLGGERNNVEVSDPYRTVKIRTRPETIYNQYANANEASNTEFMLPTAGADISVGDTVYIQGVNYVVAIVTNGYPYEGLTTVVADGATFSSGETYTFAREESYNYEWTFDNNGGFYGPAMGGIRVTGLEGIPGNPLYFGSADGIVLSTSTGEGHTGVFLDNNSVPGNKAAKLSDIRIDVPMSSTGSSGDVFGKAADDENYHYFCTGTYDGTTNIWKRIAWSTDTWGI